jgi:hypothetical protein
MESIKSFICESEGFVFGVIGIILNIMFWVGLALLNTLLEFLTEPFLQW